jgi:hypothetical protein
VGYRRDEGTVTSPFSLPSGFERVRCDWRFLGLGIYVNTQRYCYVAVQIGPLWVYLWVGRAE